MKTPLRQWQKAWDQLADWSSEVATKDYSRAMKLLSEADTCFGKDDWKGFERVYQQIHQLIDHSR